MFITWHFPPSVFNIHLFKIYILPVDSGVKMRPGRESGEKVKRLLGAYKHWG
jgi:hypothetical protein